MVLLAAALAACSSRSSDSAGGPARTASSAATADTDGIRALSTASRKNALASPDQDAAGNGDVEVPDAADGDGADAWTAMENAGLSPTFADVNQDASFDPGRDGTGCDVIDQYPAAADMATEGDEVEITIDCGQVDWENQEGSAWDDFNDAYASSFDDGCQELFDASPDGSLYEDDQEYTIYDCQNLNPGDASDGSDVPTDVPDDPESAGIELGELDGCQALFEQEGVYSLNWGSDSVTEDDCPLGGIAVTLPPRRTRHKPTLATGSCTGRQADGTRVSINTDKGKVNCTGAVALWNEWLKRAPTEGAGSSGVVEFEGWRCAGALLTDESHLGSCQKLDGTAGFTVLNA
jgi:hypothetical protein